MYAAIQKISSTQSEARVRNLEGELEQIRKREKTLEKQKAYEELLRLQPEFETIKESEDFTSWLQDQPQSISEGVYNNSTDAQWASRVIDLYKSDRGFPVTIPRLHLADFRSFPDTFIACLRSNFSCRRFRNGHGRVVVFASTSRRFLVKPLSDL